MFFDVLLDFVVAKVFVSSCTIVLGYSFRRGAEARELLRGIRIHFTKFVKPLKDGMC
jgi:hypothetical protein